MFANFTGAIGGIRTRQVETKNGTTTVANVSIANNQGDNTLWYTKALWGAKAEAALRSLKKGDKVTVSGTFQEQSWERGGKSGKNRVLSPESIVIKASSQNAPLFARIAVLEENQRRMLEILERVSEVLDAPEDAEEILEENEIIEIEEAAEVAF